MQNQDYVFPTETVNLPSKGYFYPPDSPLASGQITMKYMTAKEEDILTNQNFIEQGVVLDKLLKSLVVSDINFDELLSLDKGAILVASRVLGYGAEYSFTYRGQNHIVDLSKLEDKEVDWSIFTKGSNDHKFTLPSTGTELTFKFLTHKDDISIDQEVKGLKKIMKDSSPEASTRLKHLITSVDGNRDVATIRKFVDTQMLARDSRALRQYINKVQPDINLKFYPENGPEGGVDIPIGISFLYPDSEL